MPKSAKPAARSTGECRRSATNSVTSPSKPQKALTAVCPRWKLVATEAPSNSSNAPRIESDTPYTPRTAAAVLGVYGVSLSILGAFEEFDGASVATSFQRGHTAVSAFWGLLGLVTLFVALRRHSPVLRAAGFALFGISLAKLFLYDLGELSSITRALSFLALGGVLLVAGFVYQRLAADGNGQHPLAAG